MCVLNWKIEGSRNRSFNPLCNFLTSNDHYFFLLFGLATKRKRLATELRKRAGVLVCVCARES